MHFEAFQVSKQCVQLWKDGWFGGDDVHTGVSTLRYVSHNAQCGLLCMLAAALVLPTVFGVVKLPT